MNFLNNISLWASLAAAGAAIPILLHLISRRRHHDLDWAAMELLRKALRNQSRRIKLENLLLMILRSAAMALVALAMARPILQAADLTIEREIRQTGIVIAIDASYSMSHAAAVRRMDLALDAARTIAADLRDGDRVTLVLLCASPRVLLRNVPFDSAALAQALAQVEPANRPLALDLNLPMLLDLVNELGTPARRCVLITDAQARDFASLDDRTRGRLADLGRQSQLQIIALGGADSANLALTAMRHVSGRLAVGSTARFTTRIENFSNHVETSRTLEFIVDGQVVDRRELPAIPPLGSTTATAYLRLPRAGDVAIEARLNGDGLAIDDARRMVVSVRQRINVLLVDGDPSPNPFDSETDFLQASLRSVELSGAARTVHWERINASQLESLALDQIDVLMLANVAGLSRPSTDRIRRWVEAGGGLLLFMGDRIEPDSFNRSWHNQDQPWLPAEVGTVRQIDLADDEQGTIQANVPEHRLGQILGDLPEELVASAAIEQFVELEPTPDAIVLWTVGATGAPLLVDRAVGRGRAMVLGTSADRQWTDLPLYPIFPLFVHEAITHLVQPQQLDAYLVGQPIILPVPDGLWPERLVANSPSGREIELTRTATEQGEMIELSPAEQVGIYEISLPDAQRRLIAVNPSTEESDLRPMTDAQWSEALADVQATVVHDLMRADRLSRKATGVSELWELALITSLALLLLEGVLGKRYVRRLQVESADSSVSSSRTLQAQHSAA